MKIIYACKDFDHIELAQVEALSQLPNINSICIVTCTKNFENELSKFADVEVIPDLNKRRFHKSSCLQFEKILESFKPDLVYSVHGSSLITNIISVLKKSQFTHIAKVSYRGVIGNLHRIFNPESLFTHNNSRVDACLGTSEAVVTYLKKQPWIKNKYIDVLYPGVDVDFMTRMANVPCPLPPCSEEIKLKLGYLGSMKRKIKGFDILAESIMTLSDEYQSKVQVFCIGDPPKNIDEYKDCKSLLFLGFDENPWKYFKTFDYLVMPSKLEGLGRAGAEAMALGLPVISSGVGGIKEYVFNDYNGYLLPSNKPQCYKKLWEKLLKDPLLKEKQQRHSGAAFEKAQFFNPAKVSSKLQETFREALLIRARKSS